MADYTFLQNSDMQEALQKMLSQRTLPDSLTHFQTPSMPKIEPIPIQEHFEKTIVVQLSRQKSKLFIMN